jgi:putative glutamine amidotransferase
MIMANKKPIIGITKAPDKKFTLQFFMLQISVWIAGGNFMTIQEFDKEKAEKIDALLIGGGRDVYPALYQQKPIPKNPYNRIQDDNESQWLYYAKANNLPVLAICRGAQLLNIIQGGNIHHNLTEIYENADYPQNIFAYLFFRKKIFIDTESLFYKITSKTEMTVNSIHKRAIDKLGTDLIVTAREINQVIQIVENPKHPFFMGVQFHPERLIYRRDFRKLFQYFVKIAGGNS